MNELINDAISNPIINGITFSGGDPLEQAESFSYMAKEFKRKGLNIWCYTGFSFESDIIPKIQNNSEITTSNTPKTTSLPHHKAKNSKTDYPYQHIGSPSSKVSRI